MEVPVDLDFFTILVDFGCQVGKENRAKRHQKWHRKNDEKMKGNKMAKKSQQEVLTTRGAVGPEPWGGGRGRDQNEFGKKRASRSK